MISFEDFKATVSVIRGSLVVAGGIAVSGGVLGSFVLLKRHTLAALAIPQAVAVGVAIGLRMEWPTLPPAIVAVAICLILLVSARSSAQIDSLLAACYVGGLSISILIIANAGRHVEEMQNRFVGIDIAVSDFEMATITPALLLLAIICAALWRRWLLLAQAPAAAELAGLNPSRWQFAFYAILAAMIMLGTNSLGVVMVLALLFLPAATVLPWVRRIPAAMAASVIVAVLFVSVGLVVCIEMDWPFSQSVGGVGFASLVVSRLLALAFR